MTEVDHKNAASYAFHATEHPNAYNIDQLILAEAYLDLREKISKINTRDFGEAHTDFHGVDLSAKALVPGLSLSELVNMFEDARKEAAPADSLSANPNLWPDVRGIRTVVEAVLTAVTGSL